MKLSEAMRAGAKMGAKAIEIRHTYDGGSCALGAVEDAIGRMDSAEGRYRILMRTMEDLGIEFPCKGTSCAKPGHYYIENFPFLNTAVATLNNYCGWSREAIAEWIETIEKKLESSAAADEAKAGSPERGGSHEALTTDEGVAPVGSERLTTQATSA
jgi:hypothetical protein